MEVETRIKEYIDNWKDKGYPKGIPDEAPYELECRRLVPSYRFICMVLMRNPYNLEKLGFSREKCKIYKEIKRNEIENRKTKHKQLKLFV